jgi:hypothetical protein
MILEKQTEALVQQEGTSQESIGMSLDLDSAQILMQMLSKNLYSDSIGSTVRECASNALDSHRRAGVDKPIVVSFKPNEANNYEFSVEDFGIGLDADDVKNIISKYGKSTKRDSATELGMMGLGFKAPLAYSSSFYFVCRKDGMERKYMMYEGEDTNTIDLLYEKPTTEGNGVKVIVPVNYYDRREFHSKISEQLAYFESVYFDVPGVIDNDFQIVRSEHFQFSTLASDSKMHICLDNVYYPLEFDKVGMSNTIHFPVGLRFSLTDGIFPTPNRESIRYTKEAKEIILKKIAMVADYMVSKYNESIIETDNIIEIMNYYSSDARNLEFASGRYDIAELSNYATIKVAEPKLKGINVLNLRLLHKNRDFILKEYQVRYRIDGGKFRECKNYWNQDLKIRDMTKDRHFLLEDKLTGKKKEYLRETMGKDTGWGKNKFLIKKVKEFKLGKPNASTNYETYMDLLGLRKIQKHLWRAAIKEFQSIVGMYIDCLTKIDDIKIPDGWVDSKKRAKIIISGGTIGPKARRVKLKGEIVVKLATTLERWVDGKNCKWVPTTYNLESLHKSPHLTVYASQNETDTKLMDGLFKITYGISKTKINFVAASERELKNLEKLELHNWIKLETFMEGKNKPFKRIVTAYLIKELTDKYSDTFQKSAKLKPLSEDLANKIELLDSYRDDHYISSIDAVHKAMLAVAEENNLFDGEIYPIYKEVKAFLNRYSFVDTILDKISYYEKDDNPMMDVLRDMLKYHRRRLDWKNYNIKLNDDVVKTELTEELVEDLLED